MTTLRIPKAMQAKYASITSLTDAFCEQHLNAEYGELARVATAALSRKRPSPLSRGQEVGWAAGVIHALGIVNFLFDPSQSPHLRAREVYEGFGVSTSNGGVRSRAVRDALGMEQQDLEWTLPSQMAENPEAWMVKVNGFVVDSRYLPWDLQEAAYEQGLIPFLPDDLPPNRR